MNYLHSALAVVLVVAVVLIAVAQTHVTFGWF